MIGTLVNTLCVILGSLIGSVAGKRIPERISDSIFRGFGLIIMLIGISGGLKSENAFVMIFSLAFGIIIGEGLMIEERLSILSEKILGKNKGSSPQNETAHSDPGPVLEKSLSAAFISGTLLFVTGAMGVVGSLNAGLNGDPSMLFTKSALDFTAAVVLSSTMGWGIALSSVSVLIYQGSITILSSLLSSYLTSWIILEMGALGSVLLIGLGLNIIGVTKLRLMNYVPGVFLPPLIYPLVIFIQNILKF